MITLFLYLGSIFLNAAGPTVGIKEVLSALGAVLPVILGVVVYLWKRQQSAEAALHKAELQALKDRHDQHSLSLQEKLQELRETLKDAEQRISQAVADHNQHQHTCNKQFVSQATMDQHNRDQREQMDTIKELIRSNQDLVKDIMKSTADLVELALRQS